MVVLVSAAAKFQKANYNLPLRRPAATFPGVAASPAQHFKGAAFFCHANLLFAISTTKDRTLGLAESFAHLAPCPKYVQSTR